MSATDSVTIGTNDFAVDTVTLLDGTVVKVARDKIGFGVDGAYVDVSATNPLPVLNADVVAALTALAVSLETITVANPTDVSGLATQTTLAAVLAKLTADPATQTTLAAVLTKLSDGSQLQKKTPLTSNTTARVASSATVVTLQAANAARRALKIFNESTSVLYVKDGSVASITDYSVQVQPGQGYEWPLPIYTGIVTGLWVSANGAAQLTEGV
jgi:hypothetical protein